MTDQEYKPSRTIQNEQISISWTTIMFSRSLFSVQLYSYTRITVNVNVSYFHAAQWLQTGFGLVIVFTDHLLIVITSNYTAIADSRTIRFTTGRAKSFQSTVSSPVVARKRLPTADDPLTLGSRTISVPQLPASQGLRLSSYLTH
jgi:hypothetical protein